MEPHTRPDHHTPPDPKQGNNVKLPGKEHPDPKLLAFDSGCPSNVFAALEVLRKAAWDRFDKRREFEWRVALGLWAGMGAFGGLTIGKDSPLRGPDVVLFAIATALALLALHCSFLKGIAHRNNLDSDMSFEYQDAMHKLLNWTFSKRIEQERETVKKKRKSIITNFSIRFQLLVTLVLGSITVVALVWKSLQIDRLPLCR